MIKKWRWRDFPIIFSHWAYVINPLGYNPLGLWNRVLLLWSEYSKKSMNSLEVIFLSCQVGYKMGTTHFNFKKHEKDNAMKI